MGIVYNRKTRRQFLIGTGKTMLALPFLPSLFSSDAQAQTAFDSNRRMMIFWFEHPNAPEFWPTRSFANTPIGSSGSMEKMLSTLPSATAINPLLSHSIYDTLRSQNLLSIVRGMDVQKGPGHGPAPMGGNILTSAGNVVVSPDNCPTFDTLIDSSSSVYPASTPATVTKAMRVDFASNGFTLVRKVGSTFQSVPTYGCDHLKYWYDTKYYTLPVFYNDIFQGLTNGTVSPVDTTNQLKTNILNRVYQSFVSYKSNRKISSEDLSRMDQHLGFLSDIQKGLSVVPVTNACAKPGQPIYSLDPLVYTPLYMDLMAIAFKCGLSKYGSMYFDGSDPAWLPGLTLPAGLGLHGAIHGSNANELPYKRHAYETFNGYGLNTIASRFLAPLNVIEGNTGRTYLDNMTTVILSQMGMESITGGSGHWNLDMQQMLIGSMGGRIRSGRYIALPEISGKRLPYNAFLVTLLELMGVTGSEYSQFSSSGQGFGLYNSPVGHPLASRYYGPITELLA